MQVKVKWIKLPDAAKITDRYVNDDTLLFANYEFWRLYFPYVPMDTGTLAESVEITPKYVRHIVPYAAKIYYGDHMNFHLDRHPLACARWDVVAMQTQREKLVRAVENFMKRRGRLS